MVAYKIISFWIEIQNYYFFDVNSIFQKSVLERSIHTLSWSLFLSHFVNEEAQF
jgi:hypothetical protein